MDRIPLCCLPTPCHPLPRLSRELGVDLWMKRDDLTGFALGGNKGRKLEFLLPEIVASGATDVVSCGATGSNFLRQLAAGCAVIGVRCHAVTMNLPYDSAAGKPTLAPSGGGNKKLGERLGAIYHVFPDADWEALGAHAASVASAQQAEGREVYSLPIGGSVWQAAYAFALAAQELPDGFDVVVFASSSGGTHVGLATALDGTRVLGIAADPEPDILHDFATLSSALARATGLRALRAEEFELDLGFVGPGYGVPSEAGEAALERVARTEGILLDPIYSAKAMAGLIARAPEFSGQRVCFWHTGGTPSLF